MNKRWRYLLAGLLLVHCVNATAETLYGRVVSIADADTLTILDTANQQYKIRLAAIDGPEKGQAFGNKARQALSEICFGKEAEAKVETIDRYQRHVAEVWCDGANANETMLSKGMAWVYKEYASKFPHYNHREDAARQNRLGLWADNNPIPPWEFRKKKRAAQSP